MTWLRLGRRLPWVLGFLFLTLAVVYAAFVYLYRATRTQLEDELGQRLIAVASATAAAVNGDTWTALAAGDTAAAAGVIGELEEIRLVNGISNIFLFDSGETTVLDLRGRYPVGEHNLALDYDIEAVTTALAGLPAATRLYASHGGYLKSGYASVTGAGGGIVGGVGVEASATFFEVLERIQRTLIGAAALALAGMTLLGAGFVKLLSAQEGLENRLRRTETLATMGQMAAMLAHEIRNPLGIIRGAAERLGEQHGLAEDELYRFIPEEVDRLERTLGAYLDFARPDGLGEGDDVARALSRTAELVGHEFTRKGIDLRVDIEEGAYPVDGDAHTLQQAFLNLFLNARDALSEGGALTVTLRRGARLAEASFADTGPGMTEEVRRRAVEPFFTSKERGSGLGLAVVNRVMDDLGGRMRIRSEPGRGTTVLLSFPLSSAPPPPASARGEATR